MAGLAFLIGPRARVFVAKIGSSTERLAVCAQNNGAAVIVGTQILKSLGERADEREIEIIVRSPLDFHDCHVVIDTYVKIKIATITRHRFAFSLVEDCLLTDPPKVLEYRQLPNSRFHTSPIYRY